MTIRRFRMRARHWLRMRRYDYLALVSGARHRWIMARLAVKQAALEWAMRL